MERNPLLYIGWFSRPDSDIPVHDPAHDGPCIVCHQPLCEPVRTVSFMWVNAETSYFYRAHNVCLTEETAPIADRAALDMADRLECREKTTAEVK